VTVAVESRRRRSPGAAALEDHMRICPRCRAVAVAQLEPTTLCAAGQLLATAAYKNRARRQRS